MGLRSICLVWFAYHLALPVFAGEDAWLLAGTRVAKVAGPRVGAEGGSFGVCAAHLAAQAEAAGIQGFLNRFPVIRVGITHAPGFGHQMSSVHVARRLRELGYRGELELIYEPYTQEKLAILIPGFDPAGPPVQRLSSRQLTFIRQDEFERGAERFGEAGLGFLGAEDEVGVIFPFPGRPSTAERFRVEALVRLQPAGWIEGRHTLVTTWGHSESLDDLASLQHVLVDFEPPDLGAFLAAELSEAQSSAGVGVLKTLLAHKPDFDLGGVYDAHTSRVYTARRYAEGLALAQAHNPHLFDQGAVIPILSEMSPFNLQNLKAALDESADIGGAASLFELTDPALPKYLPPAKGKIILIAVGGLPPSVVQLFLRRSTLPPAVTGKYSRNQMLRMGKPFFETNFTDLDQDLPLPPAISSLMAFARADFQFDTDNPQNPRIFPPRRIAEVIALSLAEAGEELRDAFASFPRVDDPIAEDKTAQAILRAMRAFEARPGD